MQKSYFFPIKEKVKKCANVRNYSIGAFYVECYIVYPIMLLLFIMERFGSRKIIDVSLVTVSVYSIVSLCYSYCRDYYAYCYNFLLVDGIVFCYLSCSIFELFEHFYFEFRKVVAFFTFLFVSRSMKMTIYLCANSTHCS